MRKSSTEPLNVPPAVPRNLPPMLAATPLKLKAAAAVSCCVPLAMGLRNLSIPQIEKMLSS